jgi:hypothetical protein
MHTRVDLDAVCEARARIGAELRYGIDELRKLEREGMTHPLFAEIRQTLEQIWGSHNFDLAEEYETMVRKIYRAPGDGLDGKNPSPAVNADMLARWQRDDLEEFAALVEKVRAAVDVAPAEAPDLAGSTLLMLLQAIGPGMYEACVKLEKELAPLRALCEPWPGVPAGS